MLHRTKSPRQALWKDEHEISPINPGKQEISASRRFHDRLGNLACVECSNAHTHAKPAASDMHSHRASIVTTERSTIPVRVSFVVPYGVARTSTGITLRRSILVLTPTWFLARRQVPAARPQSSEENSHLQSDMTDGFRTYPQVPHPHRHSARPQRRRLHTSLPHFLPLGKLPNK